jgi:hypothetical protein
MEGRPARAPQDWDDEDRGGASSTPPNVPNTAAVEGTIGGPAASQS